MMKKLLLLTLLMFGCASAHAQRPLSGPVTIFSSNTNQVPLTVKSMTGQTENLQEWTDSSGNMEAFVKPDGTISAPFSVAGAEATKLLFSDTNGHIASIPIFRYDQTNQMLGVGPITPNTPFQVSLPARFTTRTSIDGNEAGSFTTGQPFGVWAQPQSVFWDVATARFGRLLDAGGTSSSVVTIIGDNPRFNSATSYQATGLMVLTSTANDNVYAPSPPIARGVVSGDYRCGVVVPATTGACFALYAEADMAFGADGTLTGAEFGMINGGVDQPILGTSTSKTALALVAEEGMIMGVNPITAAIHINGGGSTFHKGLIEDTSAITGLTVNDVFLGLMSGTNLYKYRVKADGQTLIGPFQNSTNTGDYAPASYGNVVIHQFFSLTDGNNVPATTDNKHVLVFLADGAGKMRIASGNYDTSVNGWPLTLEATAAGSTTSSEILKIDTDKKVQFTVNGASAGVSASGSFAFRNNAGTCELSNNGGAYAACSGGGSSGWTDGGANVYTTTTTDRVMIGLGSSMGDFSPSQYDGSLIVNQQIYATNACVTNCTVAGLAYDSGTTVWKFGTAHTGSGTTRRMDLTVDGSMIVRLNTSGNVCIGCTNDSVKLEVNGTVQASALNPTNLTTNRIPYYSGSILANSTAYYNGTDIRILTGSFRLDTTGGGIALNTTEGMQFDGSTDILWYVNSTTRMKLDTTSSTTATPLYLYYNGTLTQVSVGSCTVAGGSHNCLYFP